MMDDFGAFVILSQSKGCATRDHAKVVWSMIEMLRWLSAVADIGTLRVMDVRRSEGFGLEGAGQELRLGRGEQLLTIGTPDIM